MASTAWATIRSRESTEVVDGDVLESSDEERLPHIVEKYNPINPSLTRCSTSPERNCTLEAKSKYTTTKTYPSIDDEQRYHGNPDITRSVETPQLQETLPKKTRKRKPPISKQIVTEDLKVAGVDNPIKKQKTTVNKGMSQIHVYEDQNCQNDIIITVNRNNFKEIIDQLYQSNACESINLKRNDNKCSTPVNKKDSNNTWTVEVNKEDMIAFLKKKC